VDNKTVKHILFVVSLGSIYHRVIPLIESLKDENLLVVTPNENIFKFFKNYTPFPTIQIKVNSNLITKSTWYGAPINAIRSKFEYTKLFKDIKNANVYFFGTGSMIVVFSYIQKLAKHNKLFLYHPNKDKVKKYLEPTIVENWKTKIICEGIKLLLGIDIKIRKDCGLYNFCIYKKFFNKNKVKEIFQEFDHSVYKKYMKDLPILKDKKVLLLLSDLVTEGRVEKNIFTNQMNKLNLILERHYQFQFVVKPHPNLSKLYGAMRNTPQIDYYIPSQFIMNHPWEVVIADCSASLVAPEEQNLGGVKLIELVDLLQFKDKKVQKELKDFLVKWNPNLLFPKTFDELEVMLK